jgi:histidinol-phosphate/aromatic aminotransferase/cobyric acid decarboxylase-like protein
LRTFSTYHALAGLRLGYIIGDEDILSHLGHIMEPQPLNSIAPPAALASLKDKGYRKRTAQFLSAETEYALKKLQGIDRTKPIATPWGLFIGITGSAEDLKDRFADEGILIDAYEDAQGNEYLAFPFRSRPDNARFFRALRWILRN